MPLLLLLAGCDLFDDLAGFTNPVVMEAMLVGVETPSIEVLDLAGTEFEGGTAATVLLADATRYEELAEAPIEGAKVEISFDGQGWRSFRDDADGKYLIEEGLTYVPGAEIKVRVRGATDDEERGAFLRAPEPVDVSVPEIHPPGEPLVLRTDAAGVDTLAVVVLEAATGVVVFDNRPKTIEDVYALTHGQGATAVEVPGVVFGRPGAYVIGVAGLAVTEADGLENVNTTLSALAAGTIRFRALEVNEFEGD